jgi:hypothetical protein
MAEDTVRSTASYAPVLADRSRRFTGLTVSLALVHICACPPPTTSGTCDVVDSSRWFTGLTVSLALIYVTSKFATIRAWTCTYGFLGFMRLAVQLTLVDEATHGTTTSGAGVPGDRSIGFMRLAVQLTLMSEATINHLTYDTAA